MLGALFNLVCFIIAMCVLIIILITYGGVMIPILLFVGIGALSAWIWEILDEHVHGRIK